MDRFIAINVNQGDSFCLQRSGHKILVDGGRSRLGFPKQFERIIGTEILDAVVCTHADADHINGLIGFFEAGLRAREVWLPGSWTARLSDLLIHPKQFFLEIIEEIDEGELYEIKTLEDLYDKKEWFYREVAISTEEGRNLDPSHIYESIESAQDSFPFSFVDIDYWIYLVHRRKRYWRNPNLFFDAINTADKIRSLAISAYHSGAKIRWFQYQNCGSTSGGESFLKPVNSTEILRIHKHLSALKYLSLSKANKESLVFYSPGNDSGGDVLFCADSDLSFQQTLPSIKPDSIITSPHHGSEHNKLAYERLFNEGYLSEKSIIIRSDGKFRKRPGVTFKKLGSKKICTLCRHPDAESQDVVFTFGGKGWRKKNGLAWCHCI